MVKQIRYLAITTLGTIFNHSQTNLVIKIIINDLSSTKNKQKMHDRIVNVTDSLNNE